ncbi:RES family NAD+ phosphorylase [Microbacterium sp. P04]|uniref:RES family NAD+ phosphorylase n=1 Tax=Microbacterium sp. P04 TaxID=3366947 RepID=UPI003745BB80
MAGPNLVDAPSRLWRVARVGSELGFSKIDALTATLPQTGNRFDVPGGGVLYCSTTRRGCYAEVLARHRPSPAIAAIAALDPGFVPPGGIAAAWRDERRVSEIELEEPLPFVDIEHEESRAWLQDEMPGILASRSISSLDVAAVRGADRLLTRALAQHVYVANVGGIPLYSGIRYLSRHGDYECWALFDGNNVSVGSSTHIQQNDADLQHVARLWDLTIHGR